MNIQAINTASRVIPCQPIKPKFSTPSFEKRKNVPPIDINVIFQNDKENNELKYDMACQLAAYYKTQYENLLKNGGVVV